MSSTTKRVKRGAVYTFKPCMMDVIMSRHHDAVDGQQVRVIQLPGAPRPNTMGQCHIEDAKTSEFLGMVSIWSLQRRTS